MSAGPPSGSRSETSAGWVKSPHNPVLGGKLGTCFDVSLLEEAGRLRMWFSWRPRKSIALVESADGISWSEPGIVLGPNDGSGWEEQVNRPVVLRGPEGFHMWYTGQAGRGEAGRSGVGYATSADGMRWKRHGAGPVLSPEEPWEKCAVMCPHVIRDEDAGVFRMWYSGGEQYEPDAIGYAESPDGISWTKHAANPVFTADPGRAWEREKVAACQVLRHGGWHVMFYVGFETVHLARIGIARSPGGVTGWERHPANPIISPGEGTWDGEACYKPFALPDGERWRLWYNGRRGHVEQIGLAVHEGEDLGF